MFRKSIEPVCLSIIFLLTTISPVMGALTIQPGTDTWVTPADGNTQIDFADIPIPADFFGPGSDPFNAPVGLEGVPLQTNPPSTLGSTDIIIERKGSLNLPSVGDVGTIPIELVALSLRSVAPITVTTNGGMDPKLWDVEVFLSSSFSQPQGSMQVTRSCNSGGIFTADLPVIPRIFFTQIDPPNMQMVLDEGQILQLQTGDPGKWTSTPPSWLSPYQSDGTVTVDHDGDPNTSQVPVITGNNNFIAGVCMEPCEITATEICGGMCVTHYQGDTAPHFLDCLPSVATFALFGATCLDDYSCILTTPSCASLLGATYAGDNTSCLTTNCAPQPLNIPAGTDTWVTPSEGNTKLDLGSPPIPADFFGPGSDPFTDIIELEGFPLKTTAPGALGLTDMIIERKAPLSLPLPGSVDNIPIEIIALSLKSISPVTISFNGGFNSELWQVEVFLSSYYPQDQGSMTATRVCPSGGTFTSDFTIKPRIVFTRVDFPFNVVVLEDNITRQLVNSTPGKWSSIPPSWMSPCQSNGLVTVDHDGDGDQITATPEIPVPAGSNNFFAGVCLEPCEPPPVSEICSGMCIASWVGTQDAHSLECIPCAAPTQPIGATCLADSCMLSTASCASLMGRTYLGDGTNCFQFVCNQSCCVGMVGDANMSHENVGEISVGDIGAIVNMLFGTGQVPVGEQWCYDEADANLTAATALPPHITTIADISVGDIGDIVDHLFGSGDPLPPCP